MAEVKLIYVNSDSDYTEVDPLVDTTTFGGLTIGDASDADAIVFDPSGAAGGAPLIDFPNDDGVHT